jgi:hypothetical protein
MGKDQLGDTGIYERIILNWTLAGCGVVQYMIQ